MNSIIWSAARQNTVLPDTVYVDTSALYEIAAATGFSEGYKAFVRRAISADLPLIVTYKAWEELDHVIQREICRQFAREKGLDENRWEQHLRLPLVRDRITEQSRRIRTYLEGIPNVALLDYTHNSLLDLERRAIMERFSLQSADAIHVALAAREGCNTFLAHDHHFASVEGANLYTMNRTLVPQRESDLKSRLRGSDFFTAMINKVVSLFRAAHEAAPVGTPPEGDNLPK